LKKSIRKLAPLTLLSVLLLAVAPAAYASTLNVTINPQTKLAELKSVSTTHVVLTYPAGSGLSDFLKNYSSSVTWSGHFNSSSFGAEELQTSFQENDQEVRVQNMSVSYTLTAKGSDTQLVIDKETDITAWVSGVFRVVNGTVRADLGWKAFIVPGQMTLNLEDHMVEVNEVGSAFSLQFGDHPIITSAIIGMFANAELWHAPTLNFTSLNTPLSTWSKSYNPITNTTTYSKTVTGQSNLSVSVDYNGQKYSLTVTSDPSANVVTQGYSVASGDSLTILPTPMTMSLGFWIAVGAVGAVVIAGALYKLRRSRASVRPLTTSQVTTIQ
jgi:hypothetical protein